MAKSKKNIYLEDGTVNLEIYQGQLLYNLDEFGFIKIEGVKNANKFIQDWCLEYSFILDKTDNVFLIKVPACLTDSTYDTRHPEYNIY